MKGNYVLIIKLACSKDILVGKLGYIHFPQAFYAYVGSAMNGFEARLPHHLRRKKKPHWHIDYLLEQAELEEVVLCQVEQRRECLVAQALAKEFSSIPGFGSSDCKCRSHLYFAPGKDRLKAKVVRAMSIEGFVTYLEPDELVGQDKYAHNYK